MKKLLLLSAVVVSGMMSLSAQARELVLDYNDTVYSGDSTLALKRMINEKYPRLDLQEADLISVRLVAKSQFGRGTATLHIGGRDVDTRTVSGRPMDWNDNDGRTFDRIDFRYRGNDRGVWQIKLNGNIKVRRVVVEVRMEEVERNRVCFFEHVGFGGRSFCMRPGDVQNNLVPSGWNDKISSIKVEGRAEATVCEHVQFGGRCQEVSSDLRQLGPRWNDLISSIRVRR